KYTGLQARIKNACSYTVYVPCSAHSLNLIGECAASCCLTANNFFNLIQNIFTFFSASTNRWQVLSECLTGNISIKRLSDTRWSARHDACSSLSKNWSQVLKALNEIEKNPLEKPQTRCEARGLLVQLRSLEMSIMVTVWSDVLERFNYTSKKLQEVSIDLRTVLKLYYSLIHYINDIRNNYDLYEKKSIEISEIKEYKTQINRKKKRKILYDESHENESQLNSKDVFKSQTYIPIMDSLISELNKRKIAYEDINEKFKFLFCITEISSSEVRHQSAVLQKYYSKDLPVSFSNECIHFQSYLLTLPKDNAPKTILEMLQKIIKSDLQDVFPYISIALRMFLCCPASNCSAERSFSALKRIKTYLRSSTKDDRLNDLAILNIELELTVNINYDDIINKFSELKARRK
ncbi:zinc finger MYM-type protein 1-like, partial [Aphis craccivora]